MVTEVFANANHAATAAVRSKLLVSKGPSAEMQIKSSVVCDVRQAHAQKIQSFPQEAQYQVPGI